MNLPPSSPLGSLSPASAQVWLDFDGTITRRDVLDDLIEKYAVDDSWKQVELLWQSGQIGSRQCLEKEFALLRLDDAELRRFLDAVEVDPGLGRLVKLLTDFEVPWAIMSDGIDRFIHHILARNGIKAPVVRSNTIHHASSSLSLHCPHSSADCRSAAAHCKCSSITALSGPGRRSIYVGDGRSDLCPAGQVDVVFAKGTLARLLDERSAPYLPFKTLNDVAEVLAAGWSRPSGTASVVLPSHSAVPAPSRPPLAKSAAIRG